MLKVQAAVPVAAVPSRLGAYRIIGQLGRKPTPDLLVAVVPGADQPDKLYVLKLFPSEDFDNVAAVAMLVNQARLTTLLHHPSIVQTYEVVVDEGVTFMVREYLDGQSLQNVLVAQQAPDARGFDLGMRLRLACDILDGLHYAHELRDNAGIRLNVVHGDVTPRKVIITYDGRAKLLDVGLADAVTMSSPTRVSTVKGKVAYMAPEQVSNSSGPTRASDIFQIGLLLWEGAVGHGAWQGMDEYEILLRLNSKYGTLFVPPAGADPDLITICQRATAVSPDERYPTAQHFRNDVEAYMVRRGISMTAETVGRYVSDRFDEERRAFRQAIRARMKSDMFDELGPLVASETIAAADTVVEPRTIAEPGMVVQPAANIDTGAIFEHDTVVDAGALLQPAAIPDSEAMVERDTIVEPATVVQPNQIPDSGAIVEAGTTVDSGPARAFRASLVFHEPIAKPTGDGAPKKPVLEPLTVWPAPEPTRAKASNGAEAEAAPAPPSAQAAETTTEPAKPRWPRWVFPTITIAAGLLGVTLAFVLAPGAKRKESVGASPPLSPPPAAITAPAVTPPAPAAEPPAPAAEPPAPSATVEPANAEPTAVVPAEDVAASDVPVADPNPSVAPAKARAAKRAHAAPAAGVRRSKSSPASRAKAYKPGRWR